MKKLDVLMVHKIELGIYDGRETGCAVEGCDHAAHILVDATDLATELNDVQGVCSCHAVSYFVSVVNRMADSAEHAPKVVPVEPDGDGELLH